MFGFKRKLAVVFCLIFMVLSVITTHAGAASGGGTGLDDEDFSTDDSDLGYEITDSNGHGSRNSVNVYRGSSTNVNRDSSASCGGSGQDDISSLLGYVPTVAANAYSSTSNMSGVMVINVVNNKFVVTYKNGQQASEYLRD